MSAPVSKQSQALAAFAAGDRKTAFKIASTFVRTFPKPELAVMKDGYEAFLYPDFFRQLGRDPAACIEKAAALFQSRLLEQ